MRLNREACGKGISKQLFGILCKIREVDRAVTPDLQAYLREAHPEVTFAALAATGRGCTFAKKAAGGEEERLALLNRLLPAFNVAEVRSPQLGLSVVGKDDILDAAACLATAVRLFRGEAMVLPRRQVQHDERGLRMEIVA